MRSRQIIPIYFFIFFIFWGLGWRMDWINSNNQQTSIYLQELKKKTDCKWIQNSTEALCFEPATLWLEGRRTWSRIELSTKSTFFEHYHNSKTKKKSIYKKKQTTRQLAKGKKKRERKKKKHKIQIITRFTFYYLSLNSRK